MRPQRYRLALALIILAILSATWLIMSLIDMHDRLARFSAPVAVGFVVVAMGLFAISSLAAARLLWRLGRSPDDVSDAVAPDDVIRAAEIQAEKAEGVINQVGDSTARTKFSTELAEIRSDRRRKTFHVVIFGTGSAGKTSLINALVGRDVGLTEATIGTTRSAQDQTYVLDGVDEQLILTDTPGLSEIGLGGSAREAEARDLAARADLLLFVLEHDLIRSEFDPLAALARQGKRSIVVLNKVDRLDDADREAILAKLRERLDRIIPAADIVPISAAPRPNAVRIVEPDGSSHVIMEIEQPDLSRLRERIATVLDGEGGELRAGNLLLRAHLLSRAAQDQLSSERDRKAKAIIDRFQWVTAATVFTNPIPALDLMATGAVQFQMISEIAGAYGVQLTPSHAKTIGGQMVQLLLKLGMIEAASSLIAGLFKSSIVGYAAGGAVQGVTMAYLTHISGLTFTEYFRKGQTWGDGGMQAALARQFDLHSRGEFLQEFGRQAFDRVKSYYARQPAQAR
jgi:small GTP-binding protein